MKRHLYYATAIVMFILLITSLCFAVSLDTSGCLLVNCPKEKGYMTSYEIKPDGTVILKLKGECQYSGCEYAWNKHWYVTATWNGSTAYEDIKIGDAAAYTMSECNRNPWLSDSFTCTLKNSSGPALSDMMSTSDTQNSSASMLQEINKKTTSLFAGNTSSSSSPNTKYPLTWPVLTPDQKKKIAMEYEVVMAKNSKTKTPPKQPIGVMSPLVNQELAGPPAKIHLSISHDANWPVKLEFALYGKIGNTHIWIPQKINIQNQKTVYKTGPDTVTPIGITSGDAVLDHEGKWSLHASYDCPGSAMPNWVYFYVKPLNPIPLAPKTIPPGGIKLK